MVQRKFDVSNSSSEIRNLRVETGRENQKKWARLEDLGIYWMLIQQKVLRTRRAVDW